MMDVTFVVPLPPRGKGRPRAAVVAGRARLYTPAATREWEAAVAQCALPHLGGDLITGPVRVDIAAVMVRPKALSRRTDPPGLMWRPHKPDGDNIRKAVLDGLRAYWRDDAQVVCGDTLSVYARKGGCACVIVRIRTEIEDAGHVALGLGLRLPPGGGEGAHA